MPISFTCPHCGNNMNVAEQYAGQTGPCAKCGQSITIPLAKSEFGGAAGFPGASPYGAPGPAGAAPAAKAKSSTTVIVIVILAVCGIGLLVCGLLGVALLLPAVQAGREAARRTACQNNLRQIGLALHNYHDVYNCFPPAYTVDHTGKKMHSWRVSILPFLGENALFDQINMEEPWDSPANQAAGSRMPAVFRCMSDSTNASPTSVFTNYLGLTGQSTVLEGRDTVKMNAITDGTSNTIVVVETTGAGVHWMSPQELELSTFTAQGTTSQHPGGSNILLCDGSVRFLANSVPPQTRQAMGTRNGGEVVPSY